MSDLTVAQELMRFEVECLNVCPDIEATLVRMAPNINVQLLGMVVFLLSTGKTREEVLERFRQEGKR